MKKSQIQYHNYNIITNGVCQGVCRNSKLEIIILNVEIFNVYVEILRVPEIILIV